MPTITFQPTLRTIKDILKSDYYSIPRFQRPYSWTAENLDEFWSDVVDKNEDGYFIGPMVAYKERHDTYPIVDGQQRITTLTLTLCALRNEFNLTGRGDLAEGLEKYISRTDDDNIEHFVLTSEQAGEYLSSQVQARKRQAPQEATNDDQVNIKKAFDDICSKLARNRPETDANEVLDDSNERIVELKRIRDKVLSLQVIWIMLDSLDDAYTIFETLNSRGRDLDVVDLLKNLVMKKIVAVNGDLDPTRTQWNTMRTTLSNEGREANPNTYILHWWLSQFEYVSERRLFRLMKSTELGGLAADDMLKALVDDAVLYARIANPNAWNCRPEERAVRESLAALDLFKVRQPRPLLLALLRAHRDGKIRLRKLSSALRAIENFHYITTAVVGASSTGGHSQMYARYAREITTGTTSRAVLVIDKMIERLRESVSPRESFVAEFALNLRYTENSSSNKKLVQYTLKKMHDARGAGDALNHETCNIEHIEPQSSGKGWAGEFGNLLWIDGELNSQLGNLSFDEKKAKLLPHTERYDLNDVTSASSWGPAQVADRTARLAELAYSSVWRI